MGFCLGFSKTVKIIGLMLLINSILLAYSFAPSFAEIASDSVIVVRGNDDRIYWSRGNLPSDPSGTWNAWHQLPGTTGDPPAAATCGTILHIAVRGKDSGIYYGYVTLTNWTFFGWKKMVGSTPVAPSLSTTFAGTSPNYCHAFLAVRGNDNRIYWTRNSVSQYGLDAFAPWQQVPAGKTIDTPATAATTRNSASSSCPCPLDKLFLAVLGEDGHSIYFAQYDFTGATWSSWTKLPGATSHAPALASLLYYYSNSAYVYLAVTGTDSRVYWSKWDPVGISWSALAKIPTGTTTSTPSLTVNTSTSVYFAVRGTNSKIYTCYLSGSTYSGWSTIPGTTPSHPVIGTITNPS